MKEAKRHQRSIIVTLLDLRNAFGEVNHKLIDSTLRYHHVPEDFIGIIKDIYTNSMISVAHGNLNTPFIPVERGVLQGDPSSPLLFNVCFNPLMQAIIQPKHDQLGYMWGPNADLRSRSWLQFADDTAIISHDVKKAQALLNLNTAWCAWADMKVRIDKCSTFGMRKQDGTYRQFQPFLTIGDQSLPAVEDGDSFKYLGKLFDFSMKNTAIKTTLRDQLKRLLEITSNLDIKPQQKLKILRNYIPTQFKFQLRIYDISYTWIELNLDTQISNAVRDWIELPISSCVSEILSLPTNQGGLGIPSMKEIAESLRMNQRHKQHSSNNPESVAIWKTTSAKNTTVDRIILENNDRQTAVRCLKNTQTKRSVNHISTLAIQGRILDAINQAFSKTTLTKWANEVEKLASPLYRFVRKALQQQLPTASNLVRWGKSADPLCPLCQKVQSNKHVMSNCGSNFSLTRYKERHDRVLSILTTWILQNCKSDRDIYVDLDEEKYRPLSELFVSLRPDIALRRADKIIDILELTICHETNLTQSRIYKESKYTDLRNNLKPAFSNHSINVYTVEITCLGLISNFQQFCTNNLNISLTDQISHDIIHSTISSSFQIYCNRNKNSN